MYNFERMFSNIIGMLCIAIVTLFCQQLINIFFLDNKLFIISFVSYSSSIPYVLFITIYSINLFKITQIGL